MDFGALSPEINSGRMYAGPGSAPMLAAASAWDGLAAELSSAASGYQSVITALTSDGWMGPASATMIAAAAPYVTWLRTTGGQAEQTAAQAKAAAAAFEAAFAMTVPPPVIAANRAQLAALVATNVLGQNAPAIAATEAHYGQMWVQDAAAMYGYAANSAAASKVPPFAAPRPNTNPSGQTDQGAAVAQANGSTAASGVQSTLSHAISTTPNTLQALASPLQPASAGTGLAPVPAAVPGGMTLGDAANTISNFGSSSFSPLGLAGITQTAADIAVLRGAAIAAGDPLGLGAVDPFTPMLPGAGIHGGLGGLGAGLGAGLHAPGAATSAAVGRAAAIGTLAVPPSWTAATPVAAPPTTTALVSSWTAAAPAAEPGGMPGMPGVPMAGSGAGRGYGFAAPRYGFKLTVMGRPVIAG